jgi:hypothetical protein
MAKILSGKTLQSSTFFATARLAAAGEIGEARS